MKICGTHTTGSEPFYCDSYTKNNAHQFFRNITTVTEDNERP